MLDAFINGKEAFQRKEYQLAIQFFAAVLPESDEYSRALVGMGKAAFLLGHFELSSQHFDKAIALNQQNSSLALEGKALALSELGRLDEATATIQLAIEKNTASANLYYNYGQVLLRSKKYSLAVEAFQKTVQINPINEEAQCHLALSLSQAGQPQAALDLSNTIIESNLYSHLAYNIKAIALALLSQYEESIVASDTALAIIDTNPEYFFNRGCTCEKLERYQEACEDYMKAIELDEQYEKAYTNYGDCLMVLDRDVEALTQYDLAITFGDQAAYVNRGNALIRLSRFDEAIESFSSAIELTQGDVNAYIGRSLAYSKIGDSARSEADYQQALQLSQRIQADSRA